jgi:hypothetical protein
VKTGHEGCGNESRDQQVSATRRDLLNLTVFVRFWQFLQTFFDLGAGSDHGKTDSLERG